MGRNALDDIRHRNGAAAELTAAAAFVQKGCEVWWPSSGQSRADFAVSWANGFKTIQVKRATWNRSGTNEYLQVRVRASGKPYKLEDFDALVAVDDAGRVWMFPHEDIEGMSTIHLDKRGPTAGTQKRDRLDPNEYRFA